MKAKQMTSLLSFVLLILTISLLTTGGCDIEFSSDNDNGNGGNNDAVLQGTITEITPDTDIEGITVEVEDEDSEILFSDITDAGGFFRIEGNFGELSLPRVGPVESGFHRRHDERAFGRVADDLPRLVAVRPRRNAGAVASQPDRQRLREVGVA